MRGFNLNDDVYAQAVDHILKASGAPFCAKPLDRGPNKLPAYCALSEGHGGEHDYRYGWNQRAESNGE